MTTIYAVFLCGILNGQQVCQPADPYVYNTEVNCEARRRAIERNPSPAINPGVKIVCMKKTVTSCLLLPERAIALYGVGVCQPT
jgi:hypothetical protein